MTAGLGVWPYLLLAVAATYLWRGLGVLLSTRIDPQGAVFRWVTCVSYAMLAGLISRIIILPLGLLAEVPLGDRLGAVAVAFAMYFGGGRRVLAGVAAGTVALVVLVAARQNGWLGG